MPHTAYILHALRLARRNLGLTAPNPSVGCVIVKDGAIVGRGWTAAGGRPHAETLALEQAGAAARGATAYVTLEPCCHHGKTPPCTNALIRAGIAEAVIAVRDPDPRVSGKGIAALEGAGITVTENVCRAEAAEVNAGFFLRIREGRPLVTLKLALTGDGRLSPEFGVQSSEFRKYAARLESRASLVPRSGLGSSSRQSSREGSEQNYIFTSPEARTYAHLLRYRHEAILVGSGTVFADDPELTCRLAGMAHGSPRRFVLDRRHRTPEHARCQPCTVLDAPDILTSLRRIAGAGINRILAEGGAEIALVLLEAGLVDRLVLIEAPEVRGDAHAPDMGAALPKFLPHFRLESERRLGTDRVRVYALSS